MNTFLNYFLLLSFIIIVALTPAEPSFASSKLQKQTELKALQKQIKQLQNTIAVKQDSKSEHVKLLKKTEKNIGQLNKHIKNTSRSIKTSNKRLKKLLINKTSLEKSLKSNQSALKKQIVGAFVQGNNSRLQMIFNQQNPSKFQRQLMFYQYIAQQQTNIIEAVNDDIISLENTHTDIIAENKQLTKKQRLLVQQKKSLGNDRLKRKKLVANLNTQIKKQGRYLKSLNEDEKQLKQLITSINEIFQNSALPQKPFNQLKGKLPWPLKGKLKTMFGHLKPLSHLKWQGNVIYAKEGNHVRAISSGIVAYSDWLKGFGNLIIINHGGGYLSLYSHNQSLYKNAGEPVLKGDIISSAGNSGGIKKSGVYFEIRKKGKPQNPAIWCNRKNKFFS